MKGGRGGTGKGEEGKGRRECRGDEKEGWGGVRGVTKERGRRERGRDEERERREEEGGGEEKGVQFGRRGQNAKINCRGEGKWRKNGAEGEK